MTDIEISKALALAIGWTEAQLEVSVSGVKCLTETWWTRPFDYRDWNVISQIAERYDCFPTRYGSEWRAYDGYLSHYANTPQKAIAMAVIGAKK